MDHNSGSNFVVTSLFRMVKSLVNTGLLKRAWFAGLLTWVWAASGCGVSYAPSSLGSSELRSGSSSQEESVLYTHTDVIEIVRHKNSNQMRALYYLSRQVYAPVLEDECNKKVSVTVTRNGKPYGSSVRCSLYGLAYEVFASEKVGGIVLHWAAGRDLKVGDKISVTYQSPES